MTTYELRSPRGRPLFRFEDITRAKAFQADHEQRAKVRLELFKVRTIEERIDA